MNKKYQILLSSIASLLLAGAMSSCSEEYTADLTPGTDVVRIASATVGAQSRAAVDANGFTNGDKFLLSTSADGTSAAIYTLSDGKWTGTLYWNNDATSDFYAAYPNSEGSDPKPTASECYIFTNNSTVYGIVADPNNTATFTVDDTIYNVKDCWQDNGSALPTLKVSKDGSQQDN